MPGTWLWLMLMSFLQQVGSTTFDTKFDLTADPGAFLARSLSLWNPDASFGELQNQAYGYLFPQGSFFYLFDRLGFPDWVAQRFWSGLLLVVAFEGCRRLVVAMSAPESGHEAPWAAWLGGIAYATAPRLLGLSGVLSGEVLQTAVLPWVVLPVVLAQRGRLGPRTAAATSGLAMLCLGGVNAVGNLAVLPLVALVVLTGVRRPGGALLARWWVGAVALASAWWMLPLLILGRYSPPFLEYIETSTAVVRPLGWTNVVRGADHWLGFFNAGGVPWWPGANLLATEPLLIGVTAGVAALGLLGLSRSDMPWRGALVASLALGAICLTISRGGALASPLHDQFQYLLDGPLAMLRNVHKVDPLLRLPLALGLAHLAGSWSPGPVRVRSSSGVLAQAMVIVVLLVSAQPLWTGELRKPGWDRVPAAWEQAAAYLADADGTGTALVLPGSGFGQQSWGWTIDEPIQGLATTPWVSRSQVPLAPGTTIRLLDSIEQRIADGQGSPVLADQLARAGIEYVVVRRDLDLYASAAPEPARVDLALIRSPGFTKMAGFGSSGLGDQSMIDILHVDRPIQTVETVVRSDIETLAGSSEDVLSAMEAGVLDPRRPVVARGEKGWDPQVPDIIGDGYRRIERGFGALGAIGPVLGRDEPYRDVRSAHDYPGPGSSRRLYADYGPVSSVRASSSGGYSDGFGEVRADLAPDAAIDGRGSTYWQSSGLTEPLGQWLEVRFADPRSPSSVTIRAGVDGSAGVPVRRIRVQAGTLDQIVPVDPETGLAAVALRGVIDRVRISVAGLDGDPLGSRNDVAGVVALHEVSFPGVEPDRRYVVPDEGAEPETSFVLRTRPERRGCVDAGLGTSCNLLRGSLPGPEEVGISRQITVDSDGTWSVQGTAVARSTPAAQRLLEPVLSGVRIRSSSTLNEEPGVAPQLAYDADPRSFWAASPGDDNPSLQLRWPTRGTISSLSITPPSTSAVAPTSATLIRGDERRVVDLTSGTAEFEPLKTRALRIRFAPSGSGAPVGVAELSIDGLNRQRHLMDRPSDSGAICGLGPEVVVDGTVHPTEVVGNLGEVIDGTPMRVEPCGPAIDLTAGAHQVRFNATEQFSPTSLALTPPGPRPVSSIDRRETRIQTWSAARRTVDVGPGAESVMIVAENFNDGWQASIDGVRLETLRVDGWKQAFVVPAGDGGKVTLSFAPNRWYQAALLVGALCALLLLAGAGLGRRRERTRLHLAPVETGRRPSTFAGIRMSRWSQALAVVTAGLVGGPALLLGFALAAFGRRSRLDLGVLGAACVAVAGIGAAVVAAFQAGLPPESSDALTAAGFGLVIASVMFHVGVHPARKVAGDD